MGVGVRATQQGFMARAVAEVLLLGGGGMADRRCWVSSIFQRTQGGMALPHAKPQVLRQACSLGLVYWAGLRSSSSSSSRMPACRHLAQGPALPPLGDTAWVVAAAGAGATQAGVQGIAAGS